MIQYNTQNTHIVDTQKIISKPLTCSIELLYNTIKVKDNPKLLDRETSPLLKKRWEQLTKKRKKSND